MDGLRQAHAVVAWAGRMLAETTPPQGDIAADDGPPVRPAADSSTADSSIGAELPSYVDAAGLVADVAKRYGGPGQIPDPELEAGEKQRWPMWRTPKSAKTAPKSASKGKGKGKGKPPPSSARV